MSQGTGRSDLLSLKHELLGSARLDVQPLPASVRRQALLAAPVAGVTSATAGTATAAGASATLGASTSVAVGLAKLGGIGALLVSVSTATYYATEGVWPSPPTSSSSSTAPRARAQRGAPSPGARPLLGVPSASPQTLDNAPSLSVPVLHGVPSPSAHVLHGNRISRTMSADRPRDIVPTPPMSPEGAPALFTRSPEPTGNIQLQPRETLSQELALLDSARARLAAGDASTTLLRLEQYAHEFPSGALQPEAVFLRIQALSQAGQHSAATQLGGHFLHQYPTSPHTDRVRAMIQSHPDVQNP